jgi:rhamnose transport system ATP-binding protein
MYGGVCALKGVSLCLRAGEVHALAGENGAGKSTLIKILSGAVQADSGHIYLRDHLISHNTPARARSLGIGIVYQQPALMPDLNIAENIALAAERSNAWSRVNWRERNETARQLLARVGAQFSPACLAQDLTAPEQQLVELAKALTAKPSVLILDEPTAILGDQDAQNLFRIVRELKKQGTAIIYITHRFDEIFELADLVTVLRDGAKIETCPTNSLTRNKLVSLMVGREVSSVFERRETLAGAAALEVRHLSARKHGVRDVSLTVRYGEIVGIAGLVGSGRTQFAEVLFGLHKRDSGEVFIDGRQLQPCAVREAISAGIGYVPEDRRKHGLVLDMTIAHNTTLSSLNKISELGLLKLTAENQAADDFSRRLRVKAPSVTSLAGSLSGGNQQKVALARWLMTEPKVLILDEPTQGIDVAAKAEIHSLMSDLAGRGMAILMISSDMNEILGMSDRVLIMCRGEIAGELARSEASAESILHYALGHKEHVLEGLSA